MKYLKESLLYLAILVFGAFIGYNENAPKYFVVALSAGAIFYYAGLLDGRGQVTESKTSEREREDF